MSAMEQVPSGETFLQRRLREKAEREATIAPSPAASRTATLDVGNKRAHRWVERKVEESLATMRNAPAGERNHLLNSLAYSCGRLVPKWLDETTVGDQLHAAALAAGLGSLESRRTINSGLTAGMDEPRDPPVDERDSLEALVDGPVATVRPATRVDVTVEAENPEDVAPNTWLPVDLTPFLDGSYIPPEPQILSRTDSSSLIYPGRVHWLSGEPESLKSWLALLAVAQVILAGQRAMYIDLEDGAAGITARLVGMGLDPEQVKDSLHYISPDQPLSYARRAELQPYLSDVALIVIDACTESLSMQQLSPKDDVDIASWLALLPRWASKQGAAVLVLDHVVKDTETRGRWATGSQHKLAGLDGVAFTLEAIDPGGKGMRGRSRLYVSKDRHGQVRPHAVRTSGAKDWIGDLVVDSTAGLFVDVTLAPPLAEQPDFRPTVLMERVAATLAKLDRALSGKELTDRVRGKRADVLSAIACLVDDGYISVAHGARGAVLHQLVRPYPAEEDR